MNIPSNEMPKYLRLKCYNWTSEEETADNLLTTCSNEELDLTNRSSSQVFFQYIFLLYELLSSGLWSLNSYVQPECSSTLTRYALGDCSNAALEYSEFRF